GAPWREPTEEDQGKERALVDAIFRRFTGAVADARGLDEAQLARVTTGEVWLGTEAVTLGLVDRVCEDEDGAVREAQRLAGLPPEDRPRRPPPDRAPAARGARSGHGAAGGPLDRRDRGLAPGSAGDALI